MAAKPCMIPMPDSTQQWTMCPSRGARTPVTSTHAAGRRRGYGGFRRPAGLSAGAGAGHSCAPRVTSTSRSTSNDLRRSSSERADHRRGQDERAVSPRRPVPRSCSESRNRIPNRLAWSTLCRALFETHRIHRLIRGVSWTGSTSFQVNTSFRFQNSTHYRLRPQSAVRRRVYERRDVGATVRSTNRHMRTPAC